MSYVTQMSAVQASAVIAETAATTLGSSERGFISTCNLDEQATLYLEINQGLGENTQRPTTLALEPQLLTLFCGGFQHLTDLEYTDPAAFK